jgi:hypothetical protein
MANVIIIISALIVVSAACFTALYARSIHKMVSEIKTRDDEYHLKMNELQKTIISALSSNPEKIEIEMMDVELKVSKKYRSGKGANFKEREYQPANPGQTSKLIAYTNSMKKLAGNMFR